MNTKKTSQTFSRTPEGVIPYASLQPPGFLRLAKRGYEMTEKIDSVVQVLVKLTRSYWRFVKWRLERHIKEPYNRDVSLKLDAVMKRLEG